MIGKLNVLIIGSLCASTSNIVSTLESTPYVTVQRVKRKSVQQHIDDMNYENLAFGRSDYSHLDIRVKKSFNKRTKFDQLADRRNSIGY